MEKNDFNRAIKKVYEELNKKDKNWKNKKIKARFICALSICYLNKKICLTKGLVDGFISPEKKVKMDLVMIQFLFQKLKKTFGEMKPSKKYKIDHRFKAFKKIKKFL